MGAEYHHVPSPDAVERAQLTAFTRFAERSTGRRLADYPSLHRWSIEHRDEFWRFLLLWSGLAVDGDADPVCTSDSCEHAAFFPNLTLNVTENVLGGPYAPDSVAAIALTEAGAREVVTRAELAARVGRVAAGLAARGVGKGSRVAAIVPNTLDAIVLCLAATGLGATWSSVSPDMGPRTIRARFERIDPDVLVVPSRYRYQGMEHELGDRTSDLVAILSPRLIVGLDPEAADAHSNAIGLSVLTADETHASPAWPRLPFNHPLYILFSSGTTGPPKCIVHGAGGTLLQHVKEHRLHTDLGPGDVLYFQTSTGWMMWNWQLSALASGAAILLYDGSPTYPDPSRVWRTVSEEGVTVLGTSPTYLDVCRQSALEPGAAFEFDTLRLVQSTGSVLPRSLYRWLAEHVKSIPLHSISGGTDIVGCFVMGSPTMPDIAGESSCVALGMDLHAVDETGAEVAPGCPGELVCRAPFPSRPLRFHGDDDGARFREAYFTTHDGVWTHGDTVIVTERGGVEVVGRSDGVMNIRGVRIGPAEVTGIVTEFSEIAGALAVDQVDAAVPGGFRLLLFVTLSPGVALGRPLVLRMKKSIKTSTSMAHVPAEIVAVDALPQTFSGKVSLRAARDAVNGRPVRNESALQNPECLAAFRAMFRGGDN